MTLHILILAAVTAMAAPAAAANPTAIADAPRGTSVTVAGTVAGLISYDEFRLTDGTGSLVVYIGPNPMPVAAGERVTVSGVIDDDGDGTELYAREVTRADGTVINLPNLDE